MHTEYYQSIRGCKSGETYMWSGEMGERDMSKKGGYRKGGCCGHPKVMSRIEV